MPYLPGNLLREIGVDKKGTYGRHRQPSRKERRKAERSASKVSRRGHPPEPSDRRPRPQKKGRAAEKDDDDDDDEPPQLVKAQTPPKSILKRKRQPEPEPEGDGDEDDSFGEEEEEEAGPAVSKKVREKLAEDDAEIAYLEKQLGIKKGKKGLPQSFKEDGLGDLLGEIDGILEDEEVSDKKKRKAEADEWLAQKRRKAAAASKPQDDDQEDGDSDEDGMDLDGLDDEDDEDDEDDGLDGLADDLDEDMDSDELAEMEGLEDDGLGESDSDDEGDEEDDEFGGFDDEPEVAAPTKKRENPYVAPVSGNTTAKYIPPSLRQPTGSDAELTSQIRRQAQGLVNRITEANMVSILSDFEKLYREHPRQHVTSILTDLLLVHICDPSSLPDTLIILHAGFATAMYRMTGMDFGAYLVQVTAERFKEHHERAVACAREQQDQTGAVVSKETSNLITFISELYNFQLIGCNLVFDHIRLLLEELSELNAELLLRMIRMCGTSLRHDDPMALKDIVALIRPAIERTPGGEQGVSVRTKFMIETINDLKNNKMKAGASSSAVVTEHTVRMKKLLGSLNARKVKTSEPLRFGLKDIQDSDKRGKWWLVGSSWAGAAAKADNGNDGGKQGDDEDADSSSDDDAGYDIIGQGAGAPDLSTLAREQNMNTDVRRSIFVAIMSATDCEDAGRRITKLRLNRDRKREIPNVVLRCVGSEQAYNPYYAIIARRLCASDRKLGWAFQDALWKLFRRLGEGMFGEAADEEDGEEEEEGGDGATALRRLVHVAKLYGSLVAEGVVGLQVLKCLNLVYLRPKTSNVVEVLLVTAILEADAKAKSSLSTAPGQDVQKQKDAAAKASDEAIQKMFRVAEAGPELTQGLLYFLKKVLRKTDLAGGKANTRIVQRACKLAGASLKGALGEELGEE